MLCLVLSIFVLSVGRYVSCVSILCWGLGLLERVVFIIILCSWGIGRVVSVVGRVCSCVSFVLKFLMVRF